jgi:hypothetical protein
LLWQNAFSSRKRETERKHESREGTEGTPNRDGQDEQDNPESETAIPIPIILNIPVPSPFRVFPCFVLS